MEKSEDSTLTKPQSLFNRLIFLDATCSQHIHTICSPVPRPLLKTLEISGDGRFWFPIPVALYFSPLSSNSDHVRRILACLFIGSLIDLALVGLIKYLIRRPRPLYNKGMHLTVAVDHWSFPSGHSSRVCFIASFLFLSLDSIAAALVDLGLSTGHRWSESGCKSAGKIAKAFVSVVWLWSAVTSMSRVLLGRHFVMDVLAGVCLGVLEALFMFYFLRF